MNTILTDTRSSPMRTRRRWVLRIGLAMAAAGVGLALGELAMRLWGSAPWVFPIWVSVERTAYRRSANAVLGYEFKPNYRDPKADTHESLPSTNAHGQRDVERTIGKRPGTRRIVVLGDSVVAGNGIPELRYTIPAQLERALGRRDVEVLNFGVGGYCTLAEVELLRTKGIHFEPDLVIVVFVGNDYVNSNHKVAKYGPVHERPRWSKWLFAHSDLFRMASTRMNLFHFGEESDPDRWHRDAIGDQNVEQGLRQLKAISQQHGFRVLLAIWPGFADHFIADIWAPPEFEDSLSVLRTAADQGIPAFRLAEYFRRDWVAAGEPNPRTHYTIGDTLHPSPRGAAVAAMALRQFLAAHGEFLPSE